MVWDGDITSRFGLGFAGLVFAFAQIPVWIAGAIPFGAVRRLTGSRGFSSPWSASFSGSVTGLMTIPFGVAMSRIFDIDGSSAPVGIELTQTIEDGWTFYALAGAIAGLAYWLLEFSSGPSRLIALIGDARPIHRTKGLISRRVAAAIVAVAAIVILVPVARWSWSPHVSQSSGTLDVTFMREWPTKDRVGFIAWSSDPSRLTSLSGNVIAVQDERGRPEWEKTFPNARASGAVANDRVIVVPDLNRHAVFSAIDLKTGEIFHLEPDPMPGAESWAGAAVKLAMSPDGSRLAVAYRLPAQPVSVYDTHDWHRLSIMQAVPKGRTGSSAIAFSNDGRLLAFGSGRDLVIADAQSGRTLYSIATSPNSIVFSPGNDMVAVETFAPVRLGMAFRIEVFRIADGTKIASHPSSGKEALVWDPLGRFLGFAAGADTVRLWNPSTAEGSGVTLHVRPSPRYLAMSPDARCLAVGNGDFISLFGVAEQVAPVQGHQACG
jgi:hypothetical protein